MVQFICNTCGEDFSRMDSLTRHRKRKFACDTNKENGNRKRINLGLDEQNEMSPQELNVLKKEPIYSEIRDIPIEIPTFDGDEFSGKKSKSRDTLYRMMQMLKIPEHRWENIAADILTEDRNQTIKRESNTVQKDLSKFIDERESEDGDYTDESEDEDMRRLYGDVKYSTSMNKIKECNTDDEDGPLNESEIEELCKRFKSLQYDLIHKGHRENVSELLDILDVLLEADLISRADYIQTTNKVKDLL